MEYKLKETARIYADESGTHGDLWLVIGMLFVPEHGMLHPALCKVKEDLAYFNKNPRHKARYAETHFAKFKSDVDSELAKQWTDVFLTSQSYFRSIVIDWNLYQGKFFGTPFESDALKKRRAYKKWAEMLLQHEIQKLSGASFYLDQLRAIGTYEVLGELQDRFTRNYFGSNPWIKKFQSAQSWKDANQCLQLCDLLVGCIYQKLVPSTNKYKLKSRDYLYKALMPYGVKESRPAYWRGFQKNTLNEHFPKFSEWYWTPEK